MTSALTARHAEAAAPSHHKIEALTGLRGVAILLVVAGHILNQRYAPGTAAYWATLPLQYPDLGVQIFFVLSGFLITGILVRERRASGRISLRRFYRRRALRILPAYWAFLIAGALMVWAGWLAATPADLLSSLLMISNYSPYSTAEWLQHTWSLSVEEQFYLVWPLTLVLVGPRWALRIAAAGIVAVPVIRLAAYLHTGDLDLQPFHHRVDSMLMGAALGIMTTAHPDLTHRVRQVVTRWRLPVAALLVFGVTTLMLKEARGPWWVAGSFPANAAATAVLILAATDPGSRTARILRSRPLVWAGLISFSLYLWQQLFVLHDSPMPLWAGVLAAFATAVASYHLVEKPFLRLKDRQPTPRITEQP